MSVPTLYSLTLTEWLDIGLAAGGNGGALYTGGHGRSTWQVTIGDMIRDEQDVRFAGMRGKFVEFHGLQGRMIDWTGSMRLSGTGLSTVLAQRDTFRSAAGVFTFVDADSTEYTNCIMRAFVIAQKTRIQLAGSSSIVWLLPYSIVLEQLIP